MRCAARSGRAFGDARPLGREGGDKQRGGRGNAGISPFGRFATVNEHGLALGDEFRGGLRGDLGRFRSEGTGHDGEQQREGGEESEGAHEVQSPRR